MSRPDRTGRRDRTFSIWHRALPDRFGMIDLDGVKYCDRLLGGCGEPIMIIETTQVWSGHKGTSVMGRLAERADVDAYLIRYKLNACDNMFESYHGDWCGVHVITDLRVEKVYPPSAEVRDYNLEELATWFEEKQDQHEQYEQNCCPHMRSVPATLNEGNK